VPPSNRDYSHLIKLVSINHTGTRKRRNLQDVGNNTPPNVDLPVLNSQINSAGAIESSFVVPESLKSYLTFDLVFSTNGHQFASIYNTRDSYWFNN